MGHWACLEVREMMVEIRPEGKEEKNIQI